ncbi:MAG: autotransporter domain-containing protein [Hyphomicrobiaceae bacterium]
MRTGDVVTLTFNWAGGANSPIQINLDPSSSLTAGASSSFTLTSGNSTRQRTFTANSNSAGTALGSIAVDATGNDNTDSGRRAIYTATCARATVTGSITITPNPFTVGSPVTVQVTDADLNTNTGSAQSVTVSVVNGTTGESESVLLTETGNNTGIFSATLATAFGNASDGNNNSMKAQAGQVLTATYSDAANASGNAATATATTTAAGGTNGTVTITPDPFAPGNAVTLTVTDADRNTAAGSAQTVSVTVTNGATSESETRTLTETGLNTGVFSGTLSTAIAVGAGTNNTGSMNVLGGYVLTVSYSDTLTSPTGGATRTDTATASTAATFTAVKSSTATTFGTPGAVLPYEVLVTNTGNVVLTGITITDARTPNETCPATTLAPGDAMSCTASYAVTQADIDTGSVANTASIDTAQTPAQNTNTVSIPATQNRALGITKTASVEAVDAADDVIGYTITVTNGGNTTLTGVSVADPFVTNLACTPDNDAGPAVLVTSLAPGGTITCSASHAVTQDEINAGTAIANTATADSAETAPVAANASVSVSQSPALTITKAGVVADGTADADGDVVDYTITVTNTGNMTLTGVAVSDPMLGGALAGSATLVPAASATYTGSYTLLQSDLDSNGGGDGDLDNTATVTTDQTAPQTASAAVLLSRTPALTLAKSADVASVDAAGTVVQYSLTLTNTGNATLTNVSVTDPMNGLSSIAGCPVSSLAPEATATCTATYTVTQTDIDNGGPIANTATASSDQTDPVTANASVTVNRSPALTFEKSADVASIDAAGAVIHYAFKLTNTGNATLTNVSVTDSMNGLSSIAGCPVSSLAPEATATCTATYTATQTDIDNGTPITNTATADSTESDAVEASASVDVTKSVSLTLEKNVVGAAAPTDFTVSFNGPGNSDGSGAGSISQKGLAAGAYVLSESGGPKGYTAGAWSCDAGALEGSTVTLASGQSATCSITNTAEPGSLTLIKTVQNTHGGTATPEQWSLSFAKGEGEPTTVSSGTTSSVAAGTYVLTEDGPAGYVQTKLECEGGTKDGNQITIGNAEDVTCTFTNTDLASTLTLVKQTENGPGEVPFELFVSSSETTVSLAPSANGIEGQATSETMPIRAGELIISETAVPGWSLSNVTCTPTEKGEPVENPSFGYEASLAEGTATLDVPPGSDIRCTFVNSFAEEAAGSITIVKEAIGGDGTASFAFTAGSLGSFTLKPPVNDNAQKQFVGPAPGTYLIREQAKAGWSLTSLACSGGSTVVDKVKREATVTFSTGDNVVCTFANRKQTGTSGVNVVVNSGSRDARFGFVSTLPGGSTFNARTSGGSTTRSFANIAAGTYDIRVPDLAPGWRLKSLTCRDPSGNSTVNVAAAKARVPLAAGETVTCTFGFFFDEELVRQRTQEVVLNFMKHRANGLIDEQPDSARLNRRLPGSLWGGAGAGGSAGFADTPFDVTATGDDSDYTLDFSTSMSQLLQFSAAQNQKKVMGLTQSPDAGFGIANPVTAAVDTPDAPALDGRPKRQSFDIWTEGHYHHFEDDAGNADTFGHFGVVYLGGDYLVSDAFLIGALVQFDWTEERSRVTGSTVDGTGWMAGPYASLRLTPNVFLDGRLAWGQSDNGVDPFGGVYKDSFETERWLANLNLKGNWVYNSIRITPGVGYTYFDEEQKAYTDSNGVLIPGQTLTVNRLEFGPEFGTRWVMPDGTTFEPHISIKGLWDVGGELDTAVAGVAAGHEELRGKIEGGFVADTAYGPSLGLTFSYDGIGDEDFASYGGQMYLRVPLN